MDTKALNSAIKTLLILICFSPTSVLAGVNCYHYWNDSISYPSLGDVASTYCNWETPREKSHLFALAVHEGGLSGSIYCESAVVQELYGNPPIYVVNPNGGAYCTADEYYADANDMDIDDQENGENEPASCGPINLVNGNKYKIHTDISAQVIGVQFQRPEFTRVYNSRLLKSSDHVIGLNWRHSYQRNITFQDSLNMGQHVGALSSGAQYDPLQSNIYTTKQAACESSLSDLVNSAGNSSKIVSRLVGAVSIWTGDKCIARDTGGRYLATIPMKAHGSAGVTSSLTWYKLRLNRPDGTEYSFTQKVGTVVAGSVYTDYTDFPLTLESDDPGSKNKIERIIDVVTLPGGSRQLVATYLFTGENDIQESYNSDGRLTQIEYPNGVIETLTYMGNQLDRVDNNIDRSLAFAYNVDGRIESVTDDASRTWQYQYDAEGRLTKVINPDTTEKNYHYELVDQVDALTGMTDERNIRYSTFDYNAEGLARESYLGSPGALPELKISGISVLYGNGFNTATDSRGNSSTYHFSTDIIQGLMTQFDGPECVGCIGGSASYSYDIDTVTPENTTLNLLSKTEYGLQTDFDNYDLNRNPQIITEAVGTTEERQKIYTYDPRYQSKVATITEPSVFAGGSKVTTYTYDDFGNTTSEAIDGFRPDGTAVSRTIAYTYDGPFHQLTEIDGPRTDVDDRTLIDYYPDDPLQGNNRALMKKVISPLGIVLYDNITYTATGKTSSYTGENYLEVNFTYYAGNDRLETSTQTDTGTGQSRTTRFTYLATGEVTSITTGDGAADATTVTLEYDNARRLTRVYDGLGNYIEYTLDTEGNITNESIHDANNFLTKALSQSFDAYNRVDLKTQLNESVDTTFAPDGTLDITQDGKGTVTDYSYDNLLRLTAIEQDIGGSNPETADAHTQMDYDVQDNLISVVDPNNGSTSYAYDDLGNLLSQNSPDTGLTSFTHDQAGNVITMTDAKLQQFFYIYDALNRPISIDAPNTASDISMTYDICANGTGHVCAISRKDSVIGYTYNAFGEVVTLNQNVDSWAFWQTVTTQVVYDYDSAGRVRSITYPSGSKVTTNYDAAGNASTVTLNDGEVDLITSSTYNPFGKVKYQIRGNGLGLWNYLDQAYRPWLLGHGSIFFEYIPAYDQNGNPLSIIGEASNHSYDELDRLVASTGSYGSRDYEYDKVGNRLSLTIDNLSIGYGYEPKSNRMNMVSGNSVVLDENGNTISVNGKTYVYTEDNRLGLITGKSAYLYNGRGERVMKAYNKGGNAASFYNLYKTVFVYGVNGELLAEHGPNGQVIKEYVYFNKELMSMIDYTPTGTEPIQNADMDGDGAIGVEDFLIWYYDHFSVGDLSADVNGDGVLDNVDQNAVIACFTGDNCISSSYERNIYYAYNDRLGTPKALTSSTGAIVWRATHDPFGKATVNEDVDGDGSAVELNVRFPGQYYDVESGLHYNYYRTYDPESGRYLTSDPIGLSGGLNTYAYVSSNPLFWVDRLGLFNIDVSAGFSIPVFPGYTYDHSVGSTIQNVEDGNLNLKGTGHRVTNTVGDVMSAGLSIGLSNLNDSSICSEKWSVNFGPLNRRLGFSIRFLEQQDSSRGILNPTRYIDDFTINYGFGVSSPVTVTDDDI